MVQLTYILIDFKHALKHKRIYYGIKTSLQERHYWLKLRTPIMIGLHHKSKKWGYILVAIKGRGRY